MVAKKNKARYPGKGKLSAIKEKQAEFAEKRKLDYGHRRG